MKKAILAFVLCFSFSIGMLVSFNLSLAQSNIESSQLYQSSISLKALDLSRAPSAKELCMAGQLGSPLTPLPASALHNNSNSTASLNDSDRLLLGQAIQEWNQHHYPKAVALFSQHRRQFPFSPWAGEAELHLGCEAQFSGNWQVASKHFDSILSMAPVGCDIYQKAKLRKAVLEVEQDQFKEAETTFSQLLKTEISWERRTYAQRWLLDINHFKAHESALRSCGLKSVDYVLQQTAKGTDPNMGCKTACSSSSSAVSSASAAAAKNIHGYSLGELARYAHNRSKSSSIHAVRIHNLQTDLSALPTPFIAHYKDRHYVVVKEIISKKSSVDATMLVRIFDPRLERESQLKVSDFCNQWSGLALLFKPKPNAIKLASASDLKDIVGGCCGIPRYPSDLGPTPDQPAHCGLPSWSVNPVNLNVVVQDTPLWYTNSFGPPVDITITYNSQDSLNQLRPVGNKWVLNYASYAMESPGGAPSGSVLIVMPDGRGDIYQPSGDGKSYVAPKGGFNKLTKTGDYAFRLELPDGSIYLYGVPSEMGSSGFSSLLLSIADRFGNTVTISHNEKGSITKVTDPLNKVTTFHYSTNGMNESGGELLKSVEDPFGRKATFRYESGNLVSQTDMGNLIYGYSYDSNVYLTSIEKPLGKTKFYIEPADGKNNGSSQYPASGSAMWDDYRVTITDPLGYAEEYYYNGYSRYGWHRDKVQYQSKEPPLDAPKTRFDYAQPCTTAKGVVCAITYADGSSVNLSDFTTLTLQPQSIKTKTALLLNLTIMNRARLQSCKIR